MPRAASSVIAPELATIGRRYLENSTRWFHSRRRSPGAANRNIKEDTMSNTPNNGRVARFSTETKAAFKTTEFIAYVVILIAMFIASAVVDSGDDGQGFGASSVWLYATLLTIGYMISRGLAKSGSRETYDRDDNR
jgi:hypothetical protein